MQLGSAAPRCSLPKTGFKADVTEAPVKRHAEIQMRLLGELNRADRAKTEMIALVYYKGRCRRA